MPERWEGKLCTSDREIMQKIWDLGLDIRIGSGEFHLVRDPEGISGIQITADRNFRVLFQRVLDTNWYIIFDHATGKGLFYSAREQQDQREPLFKLLLLELEG